MKRIIFLVSIVSGLYAQCDNYSQSQCVSNDSCNWVSDIQTGWCSSLNTAQSCSQAPGCGWSCQGGWYLGNCYGTYGCSGGSYQIDNGYCEEIQMPECSEMQELSCTDSDNCNWIEDVEYMNCNNFGSTSCELYSDYGCSWEFSWGGWQNYGSSCVGGSFQVDNSYCEEIQMPEYDLGDINYDGSINVVDIIDLVAIILNSEYSSIGDMNNDGAINIVDIVSLVDLVLGN